MTSKTKLVSVEATIPLMAYGNIKATVESDHQDEAFSLLGDIARQVGNAEFADKLTPSEVGSTDTTYQTLNTLKTLKTLKFKDEVVKFQPETHTYIAETPNTLSGSAYADSLIKPFPKEFMAERVAKESTSAQDVLNIWEMKGEVATQFGSAVHTAMELYYKYAKNSKDIGGDTKIRPTLDLLSRMVNDATITLNKHFGEDIAKSETLTCLPELFVAHKVNADTTHLGFIDLAVMNSETKEVSIVDWKTNADITKKEKFLDAEQGQTTLDKYFHQLSFYADILKRSGYKVKELIIVHMTEDGSTLYTGKPQAVKV